MSEKELDYIMYNNYVSNLYNLMPRIDKLFNFGTSVKNYLKDIELFEKPKIKSNDSFHNLFSNSINELEKQSNEICTNLTMIYFEFGKLQVYIENPLNSDFNTIIFEKELYKLEADLERLLNIMVACQIQEIIIFSDANILSSGKKIFYIVGDTLQTNQSYKFKIVNKVSRLSSPVIEIEKNINTLSHQLLLNTKTKKPYTFINNPIEKVSHKTKNISYLKMLTLTILSMIVLYATGFIVSLLAVVFSFGLPKILSQYIGLCFLGLLITVIYACIHYNKKIKRK